jgi:3D (Asp-Asp-Asp) domain-containing protein
MKSLIISIVSLLACHVFASEYSVLARVTVYWHGKVSGANAAWNGERLREDDCAVDPKKIAFGSKVVFRDAECVAVDTGPDVVNRKAALSCGRNAAERKAIVIDRFFDTKQKALAWAKAHPHFMTVRILTLSPKQGAKLVAQKKPSSSSTNIASTATASWRERPNDFHQGLNLRWPLPPLPWSSSFLQYARRKT